MELSVGDVVVVPALGPGVVRAHEEIDVGPALVPAWRIELGDDRGTMFVPDNARGAEGLRPPIDSSRVDSIWQALASQTAPEHRRNWNQRRRRYQEMLESNSPTELARLVGELSAVAEQKADKNQRLSFGERRMLDRVRGLLARELAISTETTEDEVNVKIDAALKQQAGAVAEAK